MHGQKLVKIRGILRPTLLQCGRLCGALRGNKLFLVSTARGLTLVLQAQQL
jgi:hypothetical protein